MTPDQFDANLWALVDRTSDGCWEWLGYRTYAGYGTYEGTTAHRWTYESAVGRPIPQGLELDHLCLNRGCVRPDHLEPVTHDENLRRATEARTGCVNGHPYTAASTYLYLGKGKKSPARLCRICRKEAEARRRARVREGAA